MAITKTAAAAPFGAITVHRIVTAVFGGADFLDGSTFGEGRKRWAAHVWLLGGMD